MACDKCDICKYTNFEYIPKGTDNPTIYFISEAMSSEDNKTGDIFSSSGHQMLLSMLDAFGINFNNSRFAHIIRCYPQGGDGSYRKPNQVEINNCKEFLINDIAKCQPKLIVTLGGLVSKEFIGDEFTTITKCHGKLYNRSLDDPNLPFGENDKFYILPIYHPSFVERRAYDKTVRIDYKNDIKKILSVCNGSYTESSDSNYDYEDETISCLTYKDFDEFCKREIDGKEFIAYDNETNAQAVLSSRHKVVGFSLASRSKVGCYVTIESLDHKIDERDRKLIEARLRKILMTKKILTYNCMHELPTTLNWLGIEIPEVDDLFVMVKLLMGNAGKYAGNGGLKIQCQMNLGCKDWSEDLDTYFDYLRDFNNKKSQMTVLLSKYYKGTELDEVISKVEDLYNEHKRFDKVISYGYVPYKLISKYGGIDSSILFDLWNFYQKKISEYNSKLGIDLNKGYKYWMKHHMAGYILERNGAFWNDKVASEIEDWCNKGLVDSLTELIKSPLSEPMIKSKVEYNFSMYLKDNYLMTILGNMATPKRKYKSSVHIVFNDELPHNELKERLLKMSVFPNDKGIVKLELGHILSLYNQMFNDKDELFDRFYKNYMDEFLSIQRTDDELKGLLNPRSTIKSFKDFVSRILITPKIIYAKFYDNIEQYIESPKFSIDDYNGDRYKNDKKLLELVMKLKYDEEMSPSRKLALFIKFIDSVDQFMSYNIKNKLNSAMDYHFESMDDDHIIELYNLYEMTGINIEDRNTWNEEFKWLYHFRYYKKYAKILSTYINAKVGRNNVWYVDKSSYSNGNALTKRDILYNEVREGLYSKEDIKDKMLMYQSSFFVNGADTGRWQSGMHTIPAGKSIKRIFTSRFDGGMIAMPDCSQAEVRVLAAVSGDENLMNAFMQKGMDIHKYVGSMIFHNGDMSLVTSRERKVAKGAVFGLLYGESEKSFADSFFHGDIKEAEKVYQYFYTAFPKIKDYVDDSHNMFKTTGKISLKMFGRFIDLEPQVVMNGGDRDRVLRQAQNFIIQGQTCDLAGMILYNICEFIKKNNLKSKPFCFIHDSIEIDINPDELFYMLDNLTPLFNEYPMKTFGVPMASDIVFSSNMGAEIEMIDLVHDNNYNDVTIKLEGFVDDMDEVESTWNRVYDVCEKLDEELGDKQYVPNKGLFQKKVVISPDFGTYRQTCSRTYHVIRKLA